MADTQDMSSRVRPALVGFAPYDPAFTPCEVNLSANENTHTMPEELTRAIEGALVTTPLNRYPDPLANDLREAIAKRHGLDRDNVMVANGGDELLFNLVFAFGGQGHALVTCPPDFAEYANFAKMCETKVVEVWRDPFDFSIDEDGVVEAARAASLVFLTSPNNPTGGVVDPVLVRRLLDETDALVLVDEAYVEFAPSETSLVSWVALSPRLMVLRTMSKAFALAGLRLGYLLADPSVVGVLSAIRQIYSVDVLAQAAAKAAIEARSSIDPVVADIVAERGRLVERLSSIEGVKLWPSAANFILVRMAGASRIRERLRDEYSILVRDFSYAPGLADCLRITVGTHKENDLVINALATLLREES